MRTHIVQRRDWPEFREIRLAALKDAPSAFASTWQEEASLTASQWVERAQRSEDGDTLTIVIAADDAGHWVGLAGGYRPGDRGADAELISMWVTPSCHGHSIGLELVRAMLAWAQSHGANTIGLWVMRPTGLPSACMRKQASAEPARLTHSRPIRPSRRSAYCAASSQKARETPVPVHSPV